MAKPTQQELVAFEKAHKEQLFLLAQSNHLVIQLAKKYWNNPVKKKIVLDYAKNAAKIFANWILRQRELEKYGVPVIEIHANDFFRPSREKYINEVVRSFDAEKKGLGIVPLLVWGIILLTSAISAAFITDELVTTAEEKAELMQQTEKTIADLGLTKEQAAALLTSTQKQASEAGGGITGTIKLAIGGIATVFILSMFIKK